MSAEAKDPYGTKGSSLKGLCRGLHGHGWQVDLCKGTLQSQWLDWHDLCRGPLDIDTC